MTIRKNCFAKSAIERWSVFSVLALASQRLDHLFQRNSNIESRNPKKIRSLLRQSGYGGWITQIGK